MSSATSNSTDVLECVSTFPDLLWMCFSFIMYACIMLYIGFQLSRNGYQGSRGATNRIKFPENLIHMLYVWVIYVMFGVLSAFIAYLLGGGWTHLTTVVLSLYFITEVLHTGWMIAFFHYSFYGSAETIRLFMIGIQTYMLILFRVIHPFISIIYFVCLVIGFYEFFVNCIILLRHCKGSVKTIRTSMNTYEQVTIDERERQITTAIQEEEEEADEEANEISEA